jgi:shikimate kinase
MTENSAIILIGMPAVGKSTVGKRLAARLQRRFVDTDDLIVQHSGERLQDILDQEGYLRLREIEEQVILAEDFSGAIVATGGSAVYSAAAMRHLGAYGELVYLECSLATLHARLDNFADRGIASAPGDSLDTVYQDRCPRYIDVATFTVNVEDLSENEVVNAIISHSQQYLDNNGDYAS